MKLPFWWYAEFYDDDQPVCGYDPEHGCKSWAKHLMGRAVRRLTVFGPAPKPIVVDVPEGAEAVVQHTSGVSRYQDGRPSTEHLFNQEFGYQINGEKKLLSIHSDGRVEWKAG